jgi:cytochrome c
MDSFELNKVLGAMLAGCIVVLSVHLLADSIFAPVQPAKPGFEIAVRQPASSTPAAKAEAAAPIETRLASADVDRGKSESRVCMTCHTLDKGGPNKVGPNLWGVVDRPRASHPGFDYSAAMLLDPSARLHSRNQDDVQRNPEPGPAGEPDRLFAYAVR